MYENFHADRAGDSSPIMDREGQIPGDTFVSKASNRLPAFIDLKYWQVDTRPTERSRLILALKRQRFTSRRIISCAIMLTGWWKSVNFLWTDYSRRLSLVCRINYQVFSKQGNLTRVRYLFLRWSLCWFTSWLIEVIHLVRREFWTDAEIILCLRFLVGKFFFFRCFIQCKWNIVFVRYIYSWFAESSGIFTIFVETRLA